MRNKDFFELVKLDKYKILNKKEIREVNAELFKEIIEIIRACLSNNAASVIKQTCLLLISRELGDFFIKNQKLIFGVDGLTFIEDWQHIRIVLTKLTEENIKIVELFINNSTNIDKPHYKNKLDELKNLKKDKTSLIIHKKTFIDFNQIGKDLLMINNVQNLCLISFKNREEWFDYNWPLGELHCLHKNIINIAIKNRIIPDFVNIKQLSFKIFMNLFNEKIKTLNFSVSETEAIHLIDMNIIKIESNATFSEKKDEISSLIKIEKHLDLLNIPETQVILKVENKHHAPHFIMKVYPQKLTVEVNDSIANQDSFIFLMKTLVKQLKIYNINTYLALSELKINNKVVTVRNVNNNNNATERVLFNYLKNKENFKLTFKLYYKEGQLVTDLNNPHIDD